MGGKTAFCGSPSVHWCTEQRQALDAPWAGWRMIICWGPRWCKFDPVSRSQRCGTLTMLSDTLQRLCDPVAPAMQENRQRRLFQYSKNKIWLTRDVKVKNGVVLDFKVEHKAECEQLLSLLISLVKILNADLFFFWQWCLYLFEHKWFGPLLGGSCLPHTDGSAGATGDNQLRVWAYGTNDLTPFWQTFIYHQCLKVRIRLEVIKVADTEKDHSVTGLKFL